MNYRQLEIFRAVMDTGSATAAAQQLALSQPAVSRQLAQIEAELGLSLFARSGGKLHPTAQAAALYDEVKYALEGIDRVFNFAKQIQGHDSGILRVAAPYGLGEVLLPRIVSSMVDLHSHLRYAVEFGQYEDIAAMVARRKVDIGIVKEPVSHAGVETVPLCACSAVCVLPAGHRLERQEEVAITALAAEPLVLLGRDTAWRSELNAMFRGVKRMPQVRLDTHSSAAVCGFVRAGLGVSVLPELFAAQFADRGISLRPLAAQIDHRYAVAVPTGLRRTRIVDEFVREARKVVEVVIAASRAANGR